MSNVAVGYLAVVLAIVLGIIRMIAIREDDIHLLGYMRATREDDPCLLGLVMGLLSTLVAGTTIFN